MIKPIAVVYANLVRSGKRTLNSIPEKDDIRNQATAVVCVKEMQDNNIQYPELKGIKLDETSVGKVYYNVAKDDAIDTLINQYADEIGASSLITKWN